MISIFVSMTYSYSQRWFLFLTRLWGVIYVIHILTDGKKKHYNDVIMGGMASQITSLTIVYLSVYSGAYQRKHQSPASLVFVRGIHRWPVNSPHKGPVTRKMFPFDYVIMREIRYVHCNKKWMNRITTYKSSTFEHICIFEWIFRHVS